MNRFAVLVLGILAAALLFAEGCGKKEQGGQSNVSLGSVTGTAGGVRWMVPKRWAEEPGRPMRAATYAVPSSEGDPEGGECAVYFFGAGQGGGVDANIDRWVGQFENPGTPTKASRDIGGLKVTEVQVAGTYLSPGGPMMQSQGKKENYRLTGAIVEGPDGLVFFKLTGPSKTVTDAAGEFDAMMGSLSK
jgi:hypothetical protein